MNNYISKVGNEQFKKDIQIITSLKYHIPPTMIVIIKKRDNNKYWSWTNWTLHILLVRL